MAQVFLSYAREDARKAQAIASALEHAGHRVWWDHHLLAGAEYARRIDAELAQADAVVVLWSRHSVESAWVRDEAAAGRDAGRLVPVRIGKAEPPLGFRQYQTLDLSGRRGQLHDADLEPLIAAVAAATGSGTGEVAAKAKARAMRLPALAPFAAVIIILLAAVLWIAFSGGRTGANAATVAVLPFSDMSPDGSQSHIGEGIAEEVMGLLSADANMAVMGRGSAWQFRENPAELARIGATHALEGSVRSGRTELVVTARLVELRSGEQVWSERYEQPTANIFEVQEQIGQAVAKQLRGIFDAERQVQLAAARRTSPRAYHLFLAARAANTERSYDGATKAEKLLEQALAIDPDYAPAHAEMAITQALIAQSRPSGAGDFDRHKALLHAQRAVELAPNLANAHVALGMTIEDPEAKLRAYTKATDLDPGNIRAWNQLGNLQLRFRCEFRDAAASFQRAAAIDPLGVSVWQNLASTLFMIGRTRESEEMVGRFQANSRSPADRARLMMEHKYRMGEIAEAVGHARRGLKLLPNDPQMSVHLAWGLRSLGRTSDAIVALPSGYRAMVGSYWRGEHEQAAAALSRDHQAPPERLRLVAGKALLWAQRPDRAAHLMMNGEPTAQFAKQQFCFDNDAAPVVHALQSTGRGREAFAVLRRAEEDLTKAAANGRADYERHTYAATLAAARGQGAAAMSHLEQAIASGWVGQYHTIGPSLDDPVFAALRPTRRFEAIERVLRNRLAAQTRLLAALEKQVIAERQQARR